MRTAIACDGSGFASAFCHGVLEAFEKEGFYADGYAASSSLAPIVALAAVHSLGVAGGLHWWRELSRVRDSGERTTEAVVHLLGSIMPRLRRTLFRPRASSFTAVASVVGDESEETLRKDDVPMGRQMRPVYFDTKSINPSARLTASNIFDICTLVAAGLRQSADGRLVDGRLCFDSALSHSKPALQLVRRGFSPVIAVTAGTEPAAGEPSDVERLPDYFHGVRIYRLCPDTATQRGDMQESKASGADASDAIATVYDSGRMKGREFIDAHGHLRISASDGRP